MGKADRILNLFPSFYHATQPVKLLYTVVDQLAAPIEEADTLLFRIQRAHRLNVAEHPEDVVRLAAALHLMPFHFEDILADRDISFEDKLERMRDRVRRVARVHQIGLGTPWAVLQATAIFLDAMIVSERPGEPLIKHLDAERFSHMAIVEFDHLPEKPRERIYLHENPLVRHKQDPTARWPLNSWTITNNNMAASPVTLSIQGVGEGTVRPTIFCPDTGEGVVFNGVVPDGKTLLIDPIRGALLDGVPVDGWLISYRGGIFDFGSFDSAVVVVEDGHEGQPFDGDLESASAEYQPRRTVPEARPGASRWYFDVAHGLYDGSSFDYAVFDVPDEPIGIYDGDFAFDACLFDYPPSAIAGMAWDERLPCAFKLLLPAYIPRSKPQPAAEAPAGAAGQGQEVNYVGRIGTILPRFKPAGIRAYVDTARDAWILGESVLRSAAANDGEGVTFHATRLRDPRSDLFVDEETAS